MNFTALCIGDTQQRPTHFPKYTHQNFPEIMQFK